MTVLYVAWQDPESRRWVTVGRLMLSLNGYSFAYTRGALDSAGFVPFAQMKDLYAEYRSVELFPLFHNLLLPKSRPEYHQFLDWLDMRENDADPLALLALTGCTREHESITIFPRPERGEGGNYHVRFFSHGLRHCSGDAVERVAKLRKGEELFLMPDPQNPADGFALAIRAESPSTIIGYCPRYLSRDLLRLLAEGQGPGRPRARVERVNENAPVQFRLLCSVSAQWPDEFVPCSDAEYELLTGNGVGAADIVSGVAPQMLH